MATKTTPPTEEVIPMKKTVTSLFLFWNDKMLFIPSKANHRLVGQIDPPCCSDCFTSESERLDYVVNNFLPEKLCGKNFHSNFLLGDTPIKFNYDDELGHKLFTGYTAWVKHEKRREIQAVEFLVDPSEMWVDTVEVRMNPGIVVSPMFKKALELLFP